MLISESLTTSFLYGSLPMKNNMEKKRGRGRGGITNALANFVLLQKHGNDDDAAATAHTHVLCKDEMIGCNYSGDKRLSN